MTIIGAHRANFSWALNKYNETDNPPVQEKFVRYMAKYIKSAQEAGISADVVINGQSYPAEEVKKYFGVSAPSDAPEMTEEQVVDTLAKKVDTTSVIRKGEGDQSVYAYGYGCAPDRLKIGMSTQADCVPRIVQQINTSTPDRPILRIEIKTEKSYALERAIHGILIHRGKKVIGGGDEWFKTTVHEVIDIYEFLEKPSS